MVILQNGKRVFDKPTVESNTTTSNARVVSMYGVTSYNDLIDCIIPIKAYINGGSGANTININSLGTRAIKVISNGVESDLPDKWVLANKVYYIIYESGKFTLFTGDIRGTGSSSNSYVVSSDILDLTNTSTPVEILAALGDFGDLSGNVIDPNINSYIVDTALNGSSLIKILNAVTDIEAVTDYNTLQLEFIYESNLYNFLIKYDETNNLYVSVTKVVSPLIYANGNNMQF